MWMALHDRRELDWSPDRENIRACHTFISPASKNEVKYEEIIAGIDLAIFISSEKIIIRSDSQLVVGQVNGEYETRDQRMTKYVSLVNLRLGNLVAWQLEYVSRISNEKADALVVVAASLPIKENVLLSVYYQLSKQNRRMISAQKVIF